MTSLPRSSPLALTVLALLHYKPLHPYGIQRLIKEWGKEQVVNVGQRASLYRTIERLLEAGLITVRETERDQQYPERTVYEVTEAGREVTRSWLDEMLAVPKAEFPQFPAALSHALMLAPHELLDALERRLTSVSATLEALDAGLAAESRVRPAQGRVAGERVPAGGHRRRGDVAARGHRRPARGTASLVRGRTDGVRRTARGRGGDPQGQRLTGLKGRRARRGSRARRGRPRARVTTAAPLRSRGTSKPACGSPLRQRAPTGRGEPRDRPRSDRSR